MDIQVTALSANVSALTTILNTFFTDVAAALATQSQAIDAADEAAITASNQALTALVTSVQQQIAALPAQPAPAPGPASAKSQPRRT